MTETRKTAPSDGSLVARTAVQDSTELARGLWQSPIQEARYARSRRETPKVSRQLVEERPHGDRRARKMLAPASAGR
jgi:hypothetical protein